MRILSFGLAFVLVAGIYMAQAVGQGTHTLKRGACAS